MNLLFKSGSMKELWKISFPMMITFFSMSAMLFVDRMYLSWTCPQALTAAITAGALSWAFTGFILTFCKVPYPFGFFVLSLFTILSIYLKALLFMPI